jgi:hypothetical protein
VQKYYNENDAPVDPEKWKKDPGAWNLLKTVFFEM